MKASTFSYLDTHRLVYQQGNLVHQSSEDAGWSSLFASVQTEAPYEGSFPAIEDHLVVIALKQPVRFRRRIAGELQERVLPPGSMTITPGGADFTVKASSDSRTSSGSGPYDTVHLYVRHSTVEEIHDEMFGTAHNPSLPPLAGVTDILVQSIALEIRKMLASPELFDSFYAETLARSLAGCLLRNHIGTRAVRMRVPGALSVQQIHRATEYIEQCLEDNLNLAGIAKAAGVSTGQLARDFKARMKLTPYEYVVKARVERARHLLMSTDLPLAEIATQCGFSHQQHMTRIVHRVAGATPGAIRRSR